MLTTRPRGLTRSFVGGLCLVLGAACSPVSKTDSQAPPSCLQALATRGQFVEIPAGSFVMGAEPVYPEEGPQVRLQVSRFWLQAHEVTNAQFMAFVEDTGYITDTERSLMQARPGAGSALFVSSDPETPSVSPGQWRLAPDASWRTPEGEHTTLKGRDSLPVVHVSQRDAQAYAAWAGGRLPSEVEWEYAATLGLPDTANPTSGAYSPDGPRANTWQGVFPLIDLGTDGFQGPAPIGCYPADRLGLYDMIGNVWEWTDTPFGAGRHTLKGGSFLCADNFCRRYRPAARQPQDTDFSANHIGFRIAKDAGP